MDIVLFEQMDSEASQEKKLLRLLLLGPFTLQRTPFEKPSFVFKFPIYTSSNPHPPSPQKTFEFNNSVWGVSFAHALLVAALHALQRSKESHATKKTKEFTSILRASIYTAKTSVVSSGHTKEVDFSKSIFGVAFMGSCCLAASDKTLKREKTQWFLLAV